MKVFGRIINPLIAFIGIQLVWLVLLICWISWFMGSHRRLLKMAQKYSPELAQGGIDWFILAEGILLLCAILAGVYVIFLYWRRQAALYKAQRNFIAQVTHELKSPLASLQLHLETIRRRQPSPQKMQTFVDTMLSDTDRLGTLIDNLLSANRLDQPNTSVFLKRIDFSEFVANYFRPRQFSLPKGGTMDLELTPGLMADIDTEAMGTVFRNLLENALLYAQGTPKIHIVLKHKDRQIVMCFRDQGKGIALREQKKIFQMFYRVRQTSETIRGSGLGLFIVKAVIRLHRGKVWVESRGQGEGATFQIRLPLKEVRQ